MIKEKVDRKKIIRRIEKLSADKLDELLNFINKIDDKKSAKNKILSFAGAWENIDNSVFDDFTKHLISKRKQNLRRFNG